MPTEDRSNRTRIQFLRARTIVSHGPQKQKTPGASYQTDVNLGELCLVKKDVHGKTTESGCGITCANNIIILDGRGADFSVSGTSVGFTIGEPPISGDPNQTFFNTPIFCLTNRVQFQIVNVIHPELITTFGCGNDVGQSYDFSLANITVDPTIPPYTVEYINTDAVYIVNFDNSIAQPLNLSLSSVITVDLPFSTTSMSLGFSNIAV